MYDSCTFVKMTPSGCSYQGLFLGPQFWPTGVCVCAPVWCVSFVTMALRCVLQLGVLTPELLSSEWPSPGPMNFKVDFPSL